MRRLPYWLKGGLILAIISFIVNFYPMVNSFYAERIINNAPVLKVLMPAIDTLLENLFHYIFYGIPFSLSVILGYDYDYPAILIFTSGFWFIVGVLISWVLRKIKLRKNKSR